MSYFRFYERNFFYWNLMPWDTFIPKFSAFFRETRKHFQSGNFLSSFLRKTKKHMGIKTNRSVSVYYQQTGKGGTRTTKSFTCQRAGICIWLTSDHKTASQGYMLPRAHTGHGILAKNYFFRMIIHKLRFLP